MVGSILIISQFTFIALENKCLLGNIHQRNDCIEYLFISCRTVIVDNRIPGMVNTGGNTVILPNLIIRHGNVVCTVPTFNSPQTFLQVSFHFDQLHPVFTFQRSIHAIEPLTRPQTFDDHFIVLDEKRINFTLDPAPAIFSFGQIQPERFHSQEFDASQFLDASPDVGFPGAFGADQDY